MERTSATIHEFFCLFPDEADRRYNGRSVYEGVARVTYWPAGVKWANNLVYCYNAEGKFMQAQLEGYNYNGLENYKQLQKKVVAIDASHLTQATKKVSHALEV